MAQLFQHQLQPFEENQSPSPVHEIADPFTKLSLARSRSSRLSSNEPSSPINTLHRQLSGDPDAPPPAWKRRASFTQKPGQAPVPETEPSTSPTRSNRTSPTTELSPRPTLPPPVSRRHPQLQMTTSTRSMFTHESPNASSTSLYDPALAPPQPAFLRSKGGTRSNRSSIHSTDTSGMNSEELWNMEVEPIADLSNPQRSAMERPLDTIRRLSQRSERRPVSVSPHVSAAMPVDFMWPTAPPDEELPIRRAKSKSTTNVPSLAGRQVRLGRKKTSRQSSADPQMMAQVMNDQSLPRSNSVFISGSAHSSSTDLTKGLPADRSQSSLNRPPSTYYSRDFLSQLAPREGGYAVAAMLTSPAMAAQVSPGMVSAEEKRRSQNLENHRGSRPPTSRSAGMGRWSLDGGEHYGRPYATSSANTTQSNLSAAPPINSPQSSPPADEHGSLPPSLPDGASPPFTARSTTPPEAPIPPGATSAPIIPSPLSRAVTGTDAPPTPEATAERLPAAVLPIPPILADASRPTLSTKQSKKQLAKDAKAAEKAEAAKVVAQRATKVKEDAAKRQVEKDKAREAKEAAKRKEKEEKERKKLEKRSLSKGSGSTAGGIKSSSQLGLGTLRRTSEAAHTPPANGSGVPFPDPMGKQSPALPTAGPIARQGRDQSVPINTGSATQSVSAESKKPKLGLFGTLRKRFSSIDTSSRNTLASTSVPARTPASVNAPAPRADTSSSFLQTPASTLVQSDSVTEVESTGGGRRANGDHEPDVVVIDSHPMPQVETAPTPPPKPPSVILPTPAQAEDLPPRSTSINQSPSRPIPAPPSQTQTQAEDLPPRSTSMHPDPARAASRSPSRTPQPSSSTDSHSPPSSSTLRARNSIQGPRPMPRSGSVTSRTSRTTPIMPAAATLDTASGETALSQTQSHLTSSSGTYVESQMPMTPDEAVLGDMRAKEVGVKPEREDSGETVRVDYGLEVAAH